MSDGAKQKIDCRRSYMAFYILSDNTRNYAIGLTFVVEMLTCWSCPYGVLPSVVDFLLWDALVCVFYICINSCNRLDLLVNNRISLNLGKMRNCVMQNTNGKMRNEKKCGTTAIGPHVRPRDCKNYTVDLVAASDAEAELSAALFVFCSWVVFAMVRRLSVVGLLIFCRNKPVFYWSGWSD